MLVKQPFSRIPIIILFALWSLMVLVSGCVVAKKTEQSRPEIPSPEQTDLFIGGQGDYHTYRIPSLITTQKGNVLAFVEGRKDSEADHGHNEILLRRSVDGGKTWGPIQ